MEKKAPKVIAVIPAKADSKRLPQKNMVLLGAKPLLYYTIKVAKDCKFIEKVYVSTDSRDIADFAKKEGAGVIMRPAHLCGDAPIVEVYRHAMDNIEEQDADFIIGLQPDHPDRSADLEKVIRYVIDKRLDDLISVDKDGNKNGSIRLIRASALRENRISVNTGAIMDNATNIHSFGDLKLAEIRLMRNNEPLSIKIKNKVISRTSPVFIIAEGACNHMCDMRLAKRMIDEAEKAGVDAIKFQTYKAKRLVAKDARVYWNYASVKSQYEYYKNLDKFGNRQYRELFDYAKDKEIVVFSSPFDAESADMLNELGAPLFKVASCLMPDKKLIRHIAGFQKPIILSTGGSELQEIREAVDAIYGEDNFSLVIMACTLSYPAKNADAHILRIRKLSELFLEAIIGYSDHTEPDAHMVIPALAVTLGARVIEKHFTLDRSMTGSGHSFSVDPHLLKQMAENIRLAEEVLGDEELGVRESEEKTRSSARTSIVAKTDIPKDNTIKEGMLTLKRPGNGIPPKLIYRLIGKQSIRRIKADEQIKWSDVSK